MADSKAGDEIWGKMSLVTDEVCGGEVLHCTTHCFNRGTRKGNERGKRQFKKSVGIGGKVGKRDVVTAVFRKVFCLGNFRKTKTE